MSNAVMRASIRANLLSLQNTNAMMAKAPTIGSLQAGANELTVADPNEEGATMLALHTRQQRAVSGLSLASQAQQSVLSLLSRGPGSRAA